MWDATGPKPRRVSEPLDRHSHGPVPQALSGDGKLLVRGGLNPSLSLIDLTEGQPKIRKVLQKLGDWGAASVALSPDGRYLAAGLDATNQSYPLQVWRITTDDLQQLAFPWTLAQQVAFSPDGRTLVTTERANIDLWDLAQTPPRKRVLRVDQRWERVRHMFFVPDGRLLTVSDRDVELWDIAAGQVRYKMTAPSEVGAVALAHDGRHLAVGNSDGTIYVLRLAVK
jgi:WD40 repeat protein